MSAVPLDRSRPASLRPSRWWEEPPASVRMAFWCALAACIIGLRWKTAGGLPTYVWTRDSGSYLFPAVNWLEGGQWVTSARRGPIYSLFIAGILKMGGTLATVANVQAGLGILTTCLTLGFARTWLGRRSFWPLMICAVIYVFYGMPLELERLLRNETLLVFFATVAFGAWAFALRSGSLPWMATSGFFGGAMHLLKGIFPVFPLIVLCLAVYAWRHRPRRLGLLLGVYLGLFLLPLAVSKLYSRLSSTQRPPEPEDGQMFLGRTAQWLYFGVDGILPDIKARIHAQATEYAERYQRTGKLDNNEIVKRTIVPAIKAVIIEERGGTLVDVNRLSWRLGLEAVRHHPGAYLRQFAHDLYYLNFVSAQKMVFFDPKPLQSAARDARLYAEAEDRKNSTTVRVFDLPRSGAALEEAANANGGLQGFARYLQGIGRLRLVSPVFLTTILLPLLTYFTRGRQCLFWLGNTLLWFYYLLLLSTVGRPLDRYLMPVVPIMFWVIATATNMAWQRWHRSRLARVENTGVY